MFARRSGNILLYFLADNSIGSKDAEPYKMDVSFLCQYIADRLFYTTYSYRARAIYKLRFKFGSESLFI